MLNREIGGVIGAHAGPIYGVFVFPRLSWFSRYNLRVKKEWLRWNL